MQTEIDILKKRIVDYRAQTFGTLIWRTPPSEADLEQFLATQEPDGSWSEIDYADTSYVGSWSPWEHIMRVEALAAAFQRPESRYFRSVPILNAALRGFDCWFTRRPVCNDNSWRMGMGRNLNLKSIVLLLEDSLTTAQKEAALEQLYYLVTETKGIYEYHYPKIGIPATGQNLYWLAEIQLHAALLKNSAEEVCAAAKVINSVVEVTTEEGINPDNSFLQHGPQLYSGATGYGGIFAQDAARNLAFFHGLPWALTADQVAILRNYFLDGLQWIIRRRAWDPMTTGRQIAKKRHMEVSIDFVRALRSMQIGDPDFAPAYQAMIDHIEGRNDGNLVGNKHFYHADYTAHRRPAYSFHTRMSSERTAITETGNGENTQNSYLAQGTHILLLEGDEYSEIFPCWRWDRIPGGTAPAKNPAPITTQWAVPGTQKFVGGVSNGTYGVSAKDLNWDDVSARKSWFYFDDEIVCLGAGIRCSANSIPVFTTMNQTIRKSDVLVEFGSGQGEVVSISRHAVLTQPKWIHHANVGYFLNDTTDIELQNEVGVIGDWHSFVPGFYPKGETEIRDLMCLAIPHGSQPIGATYAYTILPGHSPAAVQQYAAAPSARIIVNTADLQAVQSEACKLSGIVFWQAGSVSLGSDLTLSVTRPCMVLIDQSGDQVTVSVSSPEPGPVNIFLTLASGSQQRLSLDLEAGISATHKI